MSDKELHSAFQYESYLTKIEAVDKYRRQLQEKGIDKNKIKELVDKFKKTIMGGKYEEAGNTRENSNLEKALREWCR